jgi:pimeloyl-ACP methyl ester carboxylesterase
MDASQGVQLATTRKLARYWQTEYDWRKCEARLNALPQFMTNIDGVDIHFIHVRSKHPNALPLIITHGWPGSIIEQMKIIDPLVNPTTHGGSASDAFDVVIPSLPGYGFSGKPDALGWDPIRIARAWVVLMKRLGYTRFVAQGGDWGNAVTEQMALPAPPELIGIALVELVVDQLPSTAGRTVPVQLGARILTGALSGSAVGAASGTWVGGLPAGAVGAVVGTLGGSAFRSRLAAAFGSDRPAAFIEDAVAIGGALLIGAALR